ncbi:glycosyltransferase [Marivirga salinae]|uniref:Glycosyltransferase n=1 Tax=Marivirga salinarum TaxID=3059078 RepID=A0AA51RCU0_9BACT|nr:glycosyltransferase [Marivirga sp. BDSF4-3]WMN12183.1 glycosyltransferase [Marivirga sp. BDSF4-3]
MDFGNKNILIISPESWEHIFVSKHHYAVHLAKKSNRVFFLNPPSGKFGYEETEFDNVYSIQYRGFLKGLRFLPSFLQKIIIRKKIKYLQNQLKANFDIIWSFDNSVFFDFSSLSKNVFCISHIVDLNQDFNTKIAARTADLCIGVNQKIVNRLRKHNSNTILIPHGVQIFGNKFDEIDLAGKNRIKAIYMGNLSMPHIDWELLLQIVLTHPFVDFILIGGGKNTNSNTVKSNVLEKSNVFLTGKISADKIPSYLKKSDILLSIYDETYATNYATPHKMMEYFSSGKMIISTWISEYEQQFKEGIILMTKNQNEFLRKFNLVVENLEEWNSSDKILKRQNFASKFTYDMQIEKIEKLLP